ncbi:hypothetical protein DFH28DRAFT_982205 [Melampsora americana]|nr:hypothetical protein DFH28DRAFT_982205 [Melampsora americana]
MPIPSQFQNLPDPALRTSISRISQFCHDLHNTFQYILTLTPPDDILTPPSPSPSVPQNLRPAQTDVSSLDSYNPIGSSSLPTPEISDSGFDTPRRNSNPELRSSNLALEYHSNRSPYAKSLPIISPHPRHTSRRLPPETEPRLSPELRSPLALDDVEPEDGLAESNPPSMFIHDLLTAHSGHSDFDSNPAGDDRTSDANLSPSIHKSDGDRDAPDTKSWSPPFPVQTESQPFVELADPNQANSRPIPAEPPTFIFESPPAFSPNAQPGIISVLNQELNSSRQSPPASPAMVRSQQTLTTFQQQDNDRTETWLDDLEEFEKKKQLILHECKTGIEGKSVDEIKELYERAQYRHERKYQYRRRKIGEYLNIDPNQLSDEKVKEIYYKEIKMKVNENRRLKLIKEFGIKNPNLLLNEDQIKRFFKRKLNLYRQKEFLLEKGFKDVHLLSNSNVRLHYFLEISKEEFKLKKKCVAEDDDLSVDLISDDEVQIKYDNVLERRWG